MINFAATVVVPNLPKRDPARFGFATGTDFHFYTKVKRTVSIECENSTSPIFAVDLKRAACLIFLRAAPPDERSGGPRLGRRGAR